MKKLNKFMQIWLDNTKQSSKERGHNYETYLFTLGLLESSAKLNQKGRSWGRYKLTQLQKVMDMAG